MDIQAFEEKKDLFLRKLNREVDIDWSEINEQLGLDWSASHSRKVAYGIREYDNYIKAKGLAFVAEDIQEELNKKSIEIKKKTVQLNDLRTEVNKQIRFQARYEQLLNMLENSIENLEKISPQKISTKENISGRKECIMCLADIHYGIDTVNNWNIYNSEIAIERMEIMINKTVEVGKLNNCKIVHIFIGGDLINNNIHLTSRMSNRETVTSQVVGVSELLSQAIFSLSEQFAYVMVHMTSGNHDRIIPSKNENDYSDNFVNIIKEFLVLRVKELDNVIFNDNKYGHDIVKFNVCGKNIVGLHGEKIPSKNVIQRLSTMYDKVDYVLSGHIHTDKKDSFSNSKHISIPSFSGMDEYSRQLGLYSNPAQKIIVLENGSNDEIIYTVDLSRE